MGLNGRVGLIVGRDGRIWIRSGGEGCTEDVTKCLIGKCDSSGGGLEWSVGGFGRRAGLMIAMEKSMGS